MMARLREPGAVLLAVLTAITITPALAVDTGGPVRKFQFGSGPAAPGLRRSLGLLVSLLAVSALWGDGLLHRLLESRPFWAWWSGGLLLLPFGFLLGVPFPTGLRLWVRPPGRRAYLWAANGTASVIASIVAVPVAMLWGVSSGLWLAAACYCLPLLLSIFVRTGRAT